MTSHNEQVQRLVEGLRAGTVSRRDFIARAMAIGFSLPMAGALFAQSAAAAGGGASSKSAARAQTTPKKGGQVIAGLSQEPTLFNPILSNLEVDRGVQYAIFDTLWRIDENAQFVPDLATEIPTVANGGISADGLNYTVKIRTDAKWHDGTPLTIKDVVFTHTTILDPKVPSPIKLGHDKVAKAETPDDFTLKMTLSEPFAPFLIVWSDTYIVPQHILQGQDLTTSDFNSTKPVGSGPFTFVSRTPGESIELAANPAYHGPGPYLDKLIVKYLQDTNILFTQFKTGEVDYTGLQGILASNYVEAQTLADRVINKAPTSFVEFIYPNFGNPIFGDKAVRQAMYDAMDKENILSTIYLDIHTNSETYLAESSWANDPNLPKHEYSPDKAKAGLDAAGWTVGDGGVRAKDGVKLSFTNSTTKGNNVREQAQQYLQQTWKDVGIDMQIDNMPPAVIWGDYYQKSKFDTVMVGEISGVGGDPDATARFASTQIPVQSGAGKNNMQYKNPELDTLLAQGAKEVDQQKRKAIYYKVQEIVRADLAVLPIFHYTNVEGTKAGLTNYKGNAFVVSNMWNVNEWFWA